MKPLKISCKYKFRLEGTYEANSGDKIDFFICRNSVGSSDQRSVRLKLQPLNFQQVTNHLIPYRFIVSFV